jgi:hypothetical protein
MNDGSSFATIAATQPPCARPLVRKRCPIRRERCSSSPHVLDDVAVAVDDRDALRIALGVDRDRAGCV